MENEIENKKAEKFSEKVKGFTNDFHLLAEKYDVKMLASCFFPDEKQQGVMKSNNLTILDELGLAKIIEQQFIS